MSPRACSTAAKQGTRSSAFTGTPMIRQRSSKWTKWGEPYTPTRNPEDSKMPSSIAQVEPLPLVPATVNTTGVPSTDSAPMGVPKTTPMRCQTCDTRSSPRSMPTGCNCSQCNSQSANVVISASGREDMEQAAQSKKGLGRKQNGLH